uniref:C3H1-type domain-containing protein n=1 Tax=Neobodo designis TaxID=312471 RepID=A0A7S1PN89_NEODS|mmetsp:Transcript_13304/g.41383  ORF Transcript_13304/g.41383 Transcript_13304/m.41383 type:complete len:408 (+) Transcript_13304:361-1584(+)
MRLRVTHVMHPDDSSCCFIVPTADVTARAHNGRRRLPTSPLQVPSAGDDQGAAARNELAPVPSLCPSCLPDDDKSRRACDFAADSSSSASGADAVASVCGGGCPHVHASLARAQRRTVHRMANPENANNAVGVVRDGNESACTVLLPGSTTATETIDVATCLATQAPIANGCDTLLSKSSPSDGSSSETVSVTPVKRLPMHCVHWLQRGTCVYGETCRFVHCFEPSPAALRAAEQRLEPTGDSRPAGSTAAPIRQPPTTTRVEPRQRQSSGPVYTLPLSATPSAVHPPATVPLLPPPVSGSTAMGAFPTALNYPPLPQLPPWQPGGVPPSTQLVAPPPGMPGGWLPTAGAPLMPLFHPPFPAAVSTAPSAPAPLPPPQQPHQHHSPLFFPAPDVAGGGGGFVSARNA